MGWVAEGCLAEVVQGLADWGLEEWGWVESWVEGWVESGVKG